jgi:hypothetical protein
LKLVRQIAAGTLFRPVPAHRCGDVAAQWQDELGEKFSVRDFHDQVLANGALLVSITGTGTPTDHASMAARCQS